jgi:hypothetical protein
LGIYAFAGVQRDDQAPLVSMQAVGQEELDDTFSLGGVPANSSFFIASLMSVIPGGLAQAFALLQVDITTGTQRGECTSQVFGKSSCSTQVPVPLGQGNVNMRVLFYGGASVSCGPPSCGGSDASVGPGIAKVIAVRVIDAKGKPVNSATISSSSGHKYPTHFASSTALTAKPNPSTQGHPVKFTATVASFGRSGAPTGRVTFKDSTTGMTLGHRTLNGGIAALTTSALAAGTHTITASYGGDDWSASSLASVSQVVN